MEFDVPSGFAEAGQEGWKIYDTAQRNAERVKQIKSLPPDFCNHSKECQLIGCGLNSIDNFLMQWRKLPPTAH